MGAGVLGAKCGPLAVVVGGEPRVGGRDAWAGDLERVAGDDPHEGRVGRRQRGEGDDTGSERDGDAHEAGGASESHSWFRVTLREGRNREVRRLWTHVGYEVSRLSRLRYGTLSLPDTLRPGQSRLLTEAELRLL